MNINDDDNLMGDEEKGFGEDLDLDSDLDDPFLDETHDDHLLDRDEDEML